jgi:hypothetical protein
VSKETVCASIKLIGQLVPGIGSALDPPPATLDTAKMPALFTWTGPATYRDLGDDWIEETRLYRVQVAVVKVGEATPDVREKRCRPLLDAARETFFKYPQLSQTLRVQEARPLGDSGIVVLPEYGGSHIGFELRLQVIEYFERSYAPYE